MDTFVFDNDGDGGRGYSRIVVDNGLSTFEKLTVRPSPMLRDAVPKRGIRAALRALKHDLKVIDAIVCIVVGVLFVVFIVD